MLCALSRRISLLEFLSVTILQLKLIFGIVGFVSSSSTTFCRQLQSTLRRFPACSQNPFSLFDSGELRSDFLSDLPCRGFRFDLRVLPDL